HAQQSDDRIQDAVESFGQADSPLRVLLASDMASEGLNLHKECHLLVHYDVPWSFIRIQQRNGRIDRYGQVHTPAIHALALADQDATSEVRVVTSLLTKEHEANKALGDAGVLMDLGRTQYSDTLEEKVVMEALAAGSQVEDVARTPQAAMADWFLAAAYGEEPVAPTAVSTPTAPRTLVFPDEDDFLAELLESQPEHTRR
ncbi:SWF/SNF helicase family protein, partial [Tsukamurella conjunctivitidis]